MVAVGVGGCLLRVAWDSTPGGGRGLHALTQGRAGLNGMMHAAVRALRRRTAPRRAWRHDRRRGRSTGGEASVGDSMALEPVVAPTTRTPRAKAASALLLRGCYTATIQEAPTLAWWV